MSTACCFKQPRCFRRPFVSVLQMSSGFFLVAVGVGVVKAELERQRQLEEQLQKEAEAIQQLKA